MAAINDLAVLFGISPTLLIILLIWSLAWKGIALWTAAKKNHLAWFIVLFIVSTIGILDILYIYVFSKKSQRQPRQQAKRSARKTARRKRRR